MNFRITYIFLSILLVNCSVGVGPAKYKSNGTPDETPHIEILSENSNLITIRHNNAGEAIALRYAYEKCESFGKKPLYQESPVQYRSQHVSTWKCVDLDFL